MTTLFALFIVSLLISIPCPLLSVTHRILCPEQDQVNQNKEKVTGGRGYGQWFAVVQDSRPDPHCTTAILSHVSG
jgi:hypothetical protein